MTYSAVDLKLELVEPTDVSPVRLFHRAGAEWDEPPATYRTMRYDPPPPHQGDYALLYMADRIEAVAMECRILSVDRRENWTYDEAKTTTYSVVQYQFTGPALFIPMDTNRNLLGLASGPFVPGYSRHQQAAHELWRRFGTVAHGLCWQSMHRHQPGRVYALWHHHKATIGLQKPAGPFHKLCDDTDWKNWLADNPDCTALSSSVALP